ncbi:MAG: hypothetical protein MI924_04260 [Chloroflexales bacterium]|nr:hypothetical protein [Chloroflexales bacterium]
MARGVECGSHAAAHKHGCRTPQSVTPFPVNSDDLSRRLPGLLGDWPIAHTDHRLIAGRVW